jgi:uncharacterized phiE125 gp8 family phage protein
MAYLALADLKSYLGISGSSEDALLDALLLAAEAAIDNYCDRTFAAASDTTRSFEALRAADGSFLLLKHELCQISSIVNGDAAGTTLSADDYVVVPRDPPYEALMLRSGTAVVWEGSISITGRWAYSISPPASIVQATREYAASLYRAYDQQADPQHRSNRSMPAHVQQVLAGYQRLR